jgi:hypothetical protein
MSRQKRQFDWSLLAILVLAGCQSEPTNQERSAVTQHFVDCIVGAVPQLDDGISDASVIAEAIIRGPCYPQAEGVVDTFTRGANAHVKQTFSEDFYEKQGKEKAVTIILYERATTLKTTLI